MIIFKVNMHIRPEKMDMLRERLQKEIETGVVLLPPYISLEYIDDETAEKVDVQVISDYEKEGPILTPHYMVRCDGCNGVGRMIVLGMDIGPCPVCGGQGVVDKYEGMVD